VADEKRGTLSSVEQALAEARSLLAGHPTVDLARERLGGRVATEPSVGQAVRVSSSLGVEHLGVVIFRKDGQVDVWLGAGRVRRVAAGATEPAAIEELSKALADIAGGAIVFGSLHEGQRVRYQTSSGELREGLLVEKCRYGALIVADGGDERVMAVGFQSIDPI
jgi:hypothetical protein